jgi:hypothetical protein
MLREDPVTSTILPSNQIEVVFVVSVERLGVGLERRAADAGAGERGLGVGVFELDQGYGAEAVRREPEVAQERIAELMHARKHRHERAGLFHAGHLGDADRRP